MRKNFVAWIGFFILIASLLACGAAASNGGPSIGMSPTVASPTALSSDAPKGVVPSIHISWTIIPADNVPISGIITWKDDPTGGNQRRLTFSVSKTSPDYNHQNPTKVTINPSVIVTSYKQRISFTLTGNNGKKAIYNGWIYSAGVVDDPGLGQWN